MTGELTQNLVVQPPKSWCLPKLRKNVICGPFWASESLLAAVWASESFAVLSNIEPLYSVRIPPINWQSSTPQRVFLLRFRSPFVVTRYTRHDNGGSFKSFTL